MRLANQVNNLYRTRGGRQSANRMKRCGFERGGRPRTERPVAVAEFRCVGCGAAMDGAASFCDGCVAGAPRVQD